MYSRRNLQLSFIYNVYFSYLIFNKGFYRANYNLEILSQDFNQFYPLGSNTRNLLSSTNSAFYAIRYISSTEGPFSFILDTSITGPTITFTSPVSNMLLSFTCLQFVSSCPFDCSTCDSTGTICLTCNSINDFRVLNGSRCIPMDGYYESNVTKAAACLNGCLVCKNSSYCLACKLNNFLRADNFCYSTC